MRIWISISLTLLLHAALLAQLSDSFTDGNITASPVWTGDVDDFVVTTDLILQLNAAVAGSSAIHSAIALGDSAEWDFFYRMAFAPSVSNKLRVYLMLDTDSPSAANGYFIEIGENGGADALRLFRLDAGVAVNIGASDGVFGDDPSAARVHITRGDDGLWTVFADQSGGENYAFLFSASESTYPLSTAQVFCIECTYTDTRRDKFFFDDVFVGIPAPDTEPAAVTGVLVEDELHITAQFSEELDAINALESLHYSVIPGIGSVSNVVFLDGAHRAVRLTLGTALLPNTDYMLQISGVRDLAGNMTEAQFPFQYIKVATPDKYDILINELMADPSPAIGLPNAEYIELYNRSDEAFQLEDFTLTVGSTTVLFPAAVLQSEAYIVLVDDANASLFTGIPDVLVMNLPALTNSGTTIELADAAGTVIHKLSYSLASYQDPARDDGGWSLELINPLSPCILATNLHASSDLTGGTPGRLNSVTMNSVADIQGPVLQRVYPVNETQILCTFDEVILDAEFVLTLLPDHPIAFVSAEDNQLEITLQTPLQSNTLYTLAVQVKDCIGNPGATQQQQFALPLPAETGDIFIHELLFDPESGGSRFIELINVSDKFIDLNELVIADIQGDTVSVFPIETSFLCLPGAIVAITPNPQDIISRYFTSDPVQIVMAAIPAFNRTSGNATVYTRAGEILDVFDYTADFHNALIDDVQGVSLERISTQLNTQSKETWYSAAAAAGFATPGLPNSQKLPDVTGDGVIVIEPSVFSPDDDGTDDFLTIQFPGAPPGSVASVRVFDATGRIVTRLTENEAIGSGTIVRWDGSDENNTRVRIGPYIIWIELYNADGTVEQYKRTCVLARRL